MNLINFILSLSIANSNYTDRIKKFNFNNVCSSLSAKLIKDKLNVTETKKIEFSDANSNYTNKIKKFDFNSICGNLSIKLMKDKLNVIKTEKIEFSSIRPYEFDCVWSLGMHCRPAHYIEKYNLRYQAAPFDWMMKYSLQEVIYQIKTGFKNFFSEIEDITPKNSKASHRIVKDKNGQTVSRHHFPKKVSAEEHKKTFRDTMIKRAKKVDNIIRHSKSVCFIREDESNNLSDVIDFGRQISQMYKNLDNIVIFYIIDSKEENLKKATKITFDNVTIISVHINDVLVNKNRKKYKNWKGNPDKWKNYVMKFISTSENFRRNFLVASLSKIIKT